MKDINAVLNAQAPALMKIKGVVGVFVGLKNDSIPCIRVMIERNDPALIKNLPAKLEGFPIEIEVSGPIVPMKK